MRPDEYRAGNRVDALRAADLAYNAAVVAMLAVASIDQMTHTAAPRLADPEGSLALVTGFRSLCSSTESLCSSTESVRVSPVERRQLAIAGVKMPSTWDRSIG